ncbi:MAG: NUDIX hydrolase N-terminal domain-containing protein [Chloroflexota bacterium]
MAEIKQRLYLLADELRNIATMKNRFAKSPYDKERAEQIMHISAQIVGLIDTDEPFEDIAAQFTRHPWLRYSPAVGVEAFVLNPANELLLIQRRDSGHWALPGGLAEVGRSFSETAVVELWEEAGLRGRVKDLLGVFDARRWNNVLKLHLIHMVYHVECDVLTPSPGTETLDAAFFARAALADITLHRGHEDRIPAAWDALSQGRPVIDAADAANMDLPMHQRPEHADSDNAL